MGQSPLTRRQGRPNHIQQHDDKVSLSLPLPVRRLFQAVP
jgi:hypothetical protein